MCVTVCVGACVGDSVCGCLCVHVYACMCVCVQAYASVHVFMSACVCVCVYVITLLLPYDISSSMKKCLALVGNSMLFTEFLNPWLYSTVAASRHRREETTIEGGMLQDNYMHHTGIQSEGVYRYLEQ